MHPAVCLWVLLSVRLASAAQVTPTASITSPSSRCSPECFQRGNCNEELGRCDCLRGWHGPACSEKYEGPDFRQHCKEQQFNSIRECRAAEQPCLNNCNRRGTCVFGVCHCTPGIWGADCSLSRGEDGNTRLLSDQKYEERTKAPLVYIYELPPELTVWGNTRRMDRSLHLLFWQRLLSSGARTADPDRAEWFYVPVRVRGPRDSALLIRALEYVNATWPYSRRLNGQRHFVFHLGDLGIQELTYEARQASSWLTWLSHWGLYQPSLVGGWDPAYRPQQDVVVPVYLSPHHFNTYGMVRSPLHPKAKNAPRRKRTLFFAGRICGDRKQPTTDGVWPNCGPQGTGYSAGVRQKVHFYHHNRTGYTIKTHVKGYHQHLMRYRFCLAPPGGGHGQRQILVSFMGCIPVVIGDYIYQPFEPFLDWSRFSIQVPEDQIDTLHVRLEAVSDSELRRMQRALRCAAQHFVWSSITGGFAADTGQYDAFETLLEVLRMKAKHPSAQPHEYITLDEDFRHFIGCGAPEIGGDVNQTWVSQRGPAFVAALKDHNPLCSHSYYDGREPPCYRCMRGHSNTHGVPGGHMCCGRTGKLGWCPRVWD